MMIPMLGFVACSNDDDDDLPNVDFHFEISGATRSEGVIYVVQGSTFEITSLTVTNNEAGKGAGITSASYYWDNFFLGTTVQPPYAFEFITNEDTPLGRHQIQVSCPVFAVDKELANAIVTLNVEVVAAEEDLPEVGTPEPTVITPTITKSAK